MPGIMALYKYAYLTYFLRSVCDWNQTLPCWYMDLLRSIVAKVLDIQLSSFHYSSSICLMDRHGHADDDLQQCTLHSKLYCNAWIINNSSGNTTICFVHIKGIKSAENRFETNLFWSEWTGNGIYSCMKSQDC